MIHAVEGFVGEAKGSGREVNGYPSGGSLGEVDVYKILQMLHVIYRERVR